MLRIFLADDEPPARRRLKKLLGEVGEDVQFSLVGEASDGVEVVEKLTSTEVDVLFLDIQMPGYDGFEVLDRLSPKNRPVVIFTTAFDEYAIRAFQANAVDYLLKPISTDRLVESIRRASLLCATPDDRIENEDRLGRLLDWMDAHADSVKGDLQQPSDTNTASYLKHLSLPYRDRILIVPVERLVSIEISEGITRVFITEEDATTRSKLKQHIVNYTLDQLGGMLDPDRFLRVHRSAIVQFDHIKELIPWFSGRYKLLLSGAHEVIASRERSKALKERLNM